MSPKQTQDMRQELATLREQNAELYTMAQSMFAYICSNCPVVDDQGAATAVAPFAVWQAQQDVKAGLI